MSAVNKSNYFNGCQISLFLTLIFVPGFWKAALEFQDRKRGNRKEIKSISTGKQLQLSEGIYAEATDVESPE